MTWLVKLLISVGGECLERNLLKKYQTQVQEELKGSERPAYETIYEIADREINSRPPGALQTEKEKRLLD